MVARIQLPGWNTCIKQIVFLNLSFESLTAYLAGGLEFWEGINFENEIAINVSNDFWNTLTKEESKRHFE